MVLMTCRGSTDCWCSLCHENRFVVYQFRTTAQLYCEFRAAEVTESRHVSESFSETLKAVSIAKAFRIAAERESEYKQLKRHLVFMGIDPDSATTMARTLNNACWVYDHFQCITDNLMTCRSIDIRRLTLFQLYLARNKSWCLLQQWCKNYIILLYGCSLIGFACPAEQDSILTITVCT